MITKNLLPQLIGGKNTQEAKVVNSWEPLENVEQFIENIETQGTNETDEKAKFNLLVSSVPSPWARVHLTCHAIRGEKMPDDNRTLIQFYEFMRSEWRGLIAAYVLYPDYFKLTKPIDLVSKELSETRGFDIISIFADMLFDDKSLWKYEKGGQDTPKIQLLYYRNGTKRQLVGGTSPFSMFFTGINYKIEPDDQIYWVSDDGKFRDPVSTCFERYYKEGETNYTHGHLENLHKLYSFLAKVNDNLGDYINELGNIWDSEHEDNDKSGYPNSRCDFIRNVLDNAISHWMDDLKAVLGQDPNENLPVNLQNRPEGPLGILLNLKTVYYWWNNTFYTAIENTAAKRIDDIEGLFIDSNDLAIWPDDSRSVANAQGELSFQKIKDYRHSPVYFLPVEENGQTWFAAIPLSENALDNIFKEESRSIITGNNDKVRIEPKKKGDKIYIDLKARIDGKGDFMSVRKRAYNIIELNSHKYVFIWPNFYSDEWTKYYYYSEYPSNASDIQMLPAFNDIPDVEKHPEVKNDKNVFSQLIKSPGNGENRYEIIRTNRPLKRIKIRKWIGSKLEELGMLLIRQQDFKPGIDDPQALYRINKNALGEATVGFDFGSTNSCSYYQIANQDVRPVPFANHRLAIIGFDNEPRRTAEPNELLFISNEEPINNNGQIKSWLHEHDEKYTDPDHMEEELVGGVPVNETNIVVRSMDNYQITTNAGRLHYNMKWLVDDVGKMRKKAFMKMVWIHICADLFEEGVYPKTLNWSYPSAMGATDMQALSAIFGSLPNPYRDEAYSLEGDNRTMSYTEAEAVCSYFISKRYDLSQNTMFLGIDIGGSTSDILVLGRDKQSVRLEEANSVANNVEEPASVSPNVQVDYDELSRKELCELVRQRGLAGKVDLDELSRQQIVDFLKTNEGSSQIDYDELSRKELCDLVRQRGLSGKVDLDDLGRQQIVEFLKGNLNNSFASVNKVSNTSVAQKDSDITDSVPGGRRRLFTQCSVRMAAGVFFEAIIKSRKFRDSIRKFHNSKETQIDVVGIESMEKDPMRAPYYLNNIFDQLHGDKDFKKFYTSLRGSVPFVFTIPAYITGALMAYSGMLMRKTILTQQLREVENVHFRYFGKGGRLFEWLFFAYNKDLVKGYLNACFKVGLKNEKINETFGRNNFEINCEFDDVEEIGSRDDSENKSEVASGLVSQHDVVGIKGQSQFVWGRHRVDARREYDARKQEVVGEMGITLNGKPVDELDLVDDNFYEFEGAISMPKSFANFEEFIDVFTQFVGQTGIYDDVNQLKEQAKKVKEVKSAIVNDQEYKKYIENINKNNEDGYRMPVFVASCLYYLKEVLLKEVFKN